MAASQCSRFRSSSSKHQASLSFAKRRQASPPFPSFTAMLRIFGLLALVSAERDCSARSLIQHQVSRIETAGDYRDYAHSGDLNHSCSDLRDDVEDIDTAVGCQEAATDMGMIFGSQGAYAGWPRNCFNFRNCGLYNPLRSFKQFCMKYGVVVRASTSS